jgi:hypothetical protein
VFAKFIVLNGEFSMLLIAEAPFSQTVKLGDAVYFKFSNDSVFKFATAVDNISSFNFGGSFSKCPRCLFYRLNVRIDFRDADFINYLVTNRLIKMKVGSLNYIVSDKAYKKIVDKANCILIKSR